MAVALIFKSQKLILLLMFYLDKQRPENNQCQIAKCQFIAHYFWK